jgi:hypothetical protein
MPQNEMFKMRTSRAGTTTSAAELSLQRALQDRSKGNANTVI